MTAYDVIGDVHGHAAKLEGLLAKLGYKHRDGAWSHDERMAVFVGDLIDRGPEQLATLRLVRSMVDAGSAQIVLGNHEFTPSPGAPTTSSGATTAAPIPRRTGVNTASSSPRSSRTRSGITSGLRGSR